MAVEYPKIEWRDFDDLLGEFKSLVPFYTPEWRLGESDKGADIALVKIFIHFLRTIYHRLNQLPQKHFISFLDRIGVKLIPAQSAMAPVTFLLSEGAAEHVLIPAGTQVAAGKVIFETERNILAAPARLVGLYSVDGGKDAVYHCPPNIISGEPVLPVETRLLHSVLRGGTEIFVESSEGLLEGDIIRLGDPSDPATDCEYGLIAAVKESHVTLAHPLDKGEPGYYRFPAIAVRGVGRTFYARLRERHKLETMTVYEAVEQKLVRTQRKDFTIGHLLLYRGREAKLAEKLRADTPPVDFRRERVRMILKNAKNCILDKAYADACTQDITKEKFPSLAVTTTKNGAEPGYYRFPAIAIKGVGRIFYQRLKEKHELKVETVFILTDEGVRETVRQDFTVKHLLQYKNREEELADVLEVVFQSYDYYYEQAENILEDAEVCILDKDYEAALAAAVASGEFPALSMTGWESGEPVSKITRLDLFQGRNRQEHILYLGHRELFQIDGDAVIVLRVGAPQSGLQSAKLYGSMVWEYWGEAVETRPPGEKENIGWHPLRFRPASENADEFYLRKTFTGEIKELTVHGTVSRWIRCKIDDINAFGEVELKDVRARVVGLRFPELPTEAIRGIEQTFAGKLAEKGVYTVGQLLKFKERVFDVARIISRLDYRERAENIIENTMKHLLDEEYENMLVGAVDVPELLPDLVFSNDQAVDLAVTDNLYLESPLYPLGKKPAPYATLYIACREIFSRPDLKIYIKFKFSQGGVGSDNGVELRWEYWDGEMWNIIRNLEDTTLNFKQDGEVVFPSPESMTATAVNGKENHWVRVRLVSGDFGQEKLSEKSVTVESTTESGQKKIETVTVFVPDYSEVKPPVVKKLTLTYSQEFTPVFHAFDCCLTANNLEFNDRSKESRDPVKLFKPFIPLEGKSREFYLAFDKKLAKGPVSLFFAILEQPITAEQIPTLRWQYYSEKQQWERLEMLDNTMSLTRTGVIEFVFPLDFKESRRFGRKAYWIRGRYGAETKNPAGSTEKIPPPITGIFLNTTWAFQCETVSGEILGSSDGTSGQSFSLKKTPVIDGSQAVWINEIQSISTEESSRILAEETYEVRRELDDKGELTAFWIRWNPIECVLYAGAEDRVYELDNVSGLVIFGDGINGKIPPTAADNIKADYRSGGGKHGNLDSYLIKDVKTAVPFLDKAFNPLAAAGGTDTETVDNLMLRGPYLLKHRGRAVTSEDFEQLAGQASPGIARVKCLPNMNEKRENQNGRVTVIVIPRTDEEKPRLTLQMQRRVEEYLRQCAAFTLVSADHLKVIGPVYAEVSVKAVLTAVSVDLVPVVEKACHQQLEEFLNPLSGGHERAGWDFGRIPCFSDFYALLEKVEGVDHVEDLSILLTIPGTEETVLRYILEPFTAVEVPVPPYIIVSGGKHDISVGF